MMVESIFMKSNKADWLMMIKIYTTLVLQSNMAIKSLSLSMNIMIFCGLSKNNINSQHSLSNNRMRWWLFYDTVKVCVFYTENVFFQSCTCK